MISLYLIIRPLYDEWKDSDYYFPTSTNKGPISENVAKIDKQRYDDKLVHQTILAGAPQNLTTSFSTTAAGYIGFMLNPVNVAGFTGASMLVGKASVGLLNALEETIRNERFAVTDDAAVICEAEGIDAVIEATGTIEFGAGVVMRAAEHGKHIVLMNVELDATLGPILKAHADRAGVVYSNSDGDEPGVAMNMLRFVNSIG